MKNFRSSLIGFIVGVLIAVPVTALSESSAKIEALLFPDIKVVVDNEEVKLESTPVIVDGRTYLPLRELGERVMGMDVTWDQETKTASLTTKTVQQEDSELTEEQRQQQETFRKAMMERRSEYFDYDAELRIDEIVSLIQLIESEIRLEEKYLEDAEKIRDPERFPPHINEVVVEGMEQLKQAREYWQTKLNDFQQPTE